jgi:hypothetical protein
MNYSIDRSFSSDGLYTFSSDTSSYILKMRESAPRSGLWTIDFIKSSGEPSPKEVFRTMKIISDLCKEFIDSVNGNKVIMFIAGDPVTSAQKAKVFSRWMGENWKCEISEPQIKIPGLRNSAILPTPFSIIATRISNSKQEETVSTSIPANTDIKFCFNCGSPNNSYQFCPSCGTQLKQ